MRRLLFPVEVVAEASGRFYVSGRVCGDLIRLGDCFTAGVPEQEWDQGIAAPHARPVALLVRSILLYRKYRNQVGPGMTAELELEALGGETPMVREPPMVGEAFVGETEAPAFAEYEV